MSTRGTILAVTIWLVAGCGGISGPDLSACLANPDSAFLDEARASYDRFTDSTVVTVSSPFGLALGAASAYLQAQDGREEESMPSVYATFSCAGRATCRPEEVTLVISATSLEGRVNGRPDQLIFLLNQSERAVVDSVQYQREADTFGGEVIVDEWVAAALPYQRFAQIACADTVEYQVGGLESGFETHHKKRLRQLLRVVEEDWPYDSVATDEE